MRYNPFINYFLEHYGCRLQKVVVNAGFTCPNRDGTCKSKTFSGYGGCTYCNNDAFHPNYSTPDKSIGMQIDEGIEFHKIRYHKTQQYLAYFQPYTNTYAPLEKLKEIYAQALEHPQIRGIVVGTRPDCIDSEKLDYFQELNEGTQNLKEDAEKKIVILEYGIESCYDKTLERIHRGHNFECAAKAIEQTAERGITQCAHFIFGLPGETLRQMEDSAQIINSLPLTALKFHQLQIIKGTQMEEEFKNRPEDFVTFSLEGYIDFMAHYLENLRPEFYIDRFAGEVPPRFVSKTPWGLVRYQELRDMLEKRMESLNISQGDRL